MEKFTAMLKRWGFTKCRTVSNVFYVIAGVLIVYRMLFVENSDPLVIPLLGVGFVAFFIGAAIYYKGCTCPKCGKVQPRYAKYRCVDCHTELK